MIGEGYQKHWKEVYGFDFAEISRDSSPVSDSVQKKKNILNVLFKTFFTD